MIPHMILSKFCPKLKVGVLTVFLRFLQSSRCITRGSVVYTLNINYLNLSSHFDCLHYLLYANEISVLPLFFPRKVGLVNLMLVAVIICKTRPWSPIDATCSSAETQPPIKLIIVSPEISVPGSEQLGRWSSNLALGIVVFSLFLLRVRRISHFCPCRYCCNMIRTRPPLI